MCANPLPGFAGAEQFAQARELLIERGFTDQGVLSTLKATANNLKQDAVPLMLYRTRQRRPLDVLIRLFLMNVEVEADDLAEALAPMSVDDWIQSGLVRREESGLRSTVKLLPFRNIYLASDHSPTNRGQMAEDFVMGIGRSTMTLSDAIVPLEDARALDLGTGCGSVAFLLATCSQHVIGVDLNDRAIDIARFNAAFNAIDNVEFRAGDMLQPVADERFDLVASNPPFVISPSSQFIYRDSGLGGDGVTQQIVRSVPALLNPGGYCAILTNWAHVTGSTPRERVQSWFEGTGCDAWALTYDTFDPGTYASNWIQHSEDSQPEHYSATFNKWLSYYEEQKIEAISGGVLMMRKSDRGQNWFRYDEIPRPEGSFGAAARLGFELHDFLLAHSDEQLLTIAYRVAPQVRLRQDCEWQPGGWSVDGVELRLDEGISNVGRVDMFTADLLAGCDGARPLGQVLSEIASRLDSVPDGLSAGVAKVARQLVSAGMLIPTREMGA